MMELHEASQPQEETAIHFRDGILGFEDTHDYFLYHEDDDNILWSLTAKGGVPSFLAVNPFSVLADYAPKLSAQDEEYFGRPDPADLCFLAIAVIKPVLTESVVNLKAPIVIDSSTRLAKQVILEDSDYPIRRRLFAGRRGGEGI